MYKSITMPAAKEYGVQQWAEFTETKLPKYFLKPWPLQSQEIPLFETYCQIGQNALESYIETINILLQSEDLTQKFTSSLNFIFTFSDFGRTERSTLERSVKANFHSLFSSFDIFLIEVVSTCIVFQQQLIYALESNAHALNFQAIEKIRSPGKNSGWKLILSMNPSHIP